MKNINIYIVGGSNHYASWINGAVLVYCVDDADVVFFTGGEDVHESIYGGPYNPKTGSNLKRDKYESIIFDEAVAKGKFILGVCRGSQFSCAKSGGLLVQHCVNHGIYGGHDITTYDGEVLNITSTHHQMMFPYNLNPDDYKMIAVSSVVRSDIHESVDWKDSYEEPEIVFFKKTNALAIQGHPEMMNKSSKTIEYLNKLFLKFINNEI